TISSKRAKALGYIYMGISSSLVLGVPIGIVVTNVFGWRAIFLGIAILTIGSMILIIKYFDEILAGTVQPLLEQLKALTNKKIILHQLAKMFMLAAHYTVYAYFKPFVESTLGLETTWISVFYLLLGIASTAGGVIDGGLATLIGSRKNILIILGSICLSLFI